jgi:hypothetical protein
LARYKILSNSQDHLRAAIAFVRSRIPPEHRSCWSLARGAPPTKADVLGYTSQWGEYQRPRPFVFWFAQRYDDVGVELMMFHG